MPDTLIRPLTTADVPACADILCAVYNNEWWQCRWSSGDAAAYLADYMEARRFIGFAAEQDGRVIGAAFAHEKLWWNNAEIFLDEMFVHPCCQGQGVGRRLMAVLEAHAVANDLAGITLTTNRYAPAPAFYRHLSFADCEHVLFMAKELPHDPT
ncbi:MAG: GNAT family N-acetyltransferase [Clostridia bacterium]|nr:GNAT family N-acetyltransferase [Clostridia bacterium]